MVVAARPLKIVSIDHVSALATERETIRAAAYQRISLDKAGDEHGVANQVADQERVAEARGYTITVTESDNDISALTGKHRPGYERIIAAAARGEIDVILVFQTSRFWRNRRERAEGIEILRKAGVSIVATKGPSLDMSTAYGRAMAGLNGEFDTMESEVKSERQQLANREAAIAGKARTAQPRPFGWRDDYVTADPEEKAAVADACRALLAGGTVSGVVRDWTARGVRPRQSASGKWTRPSVRTILMNPRNAGISVYRGREVGRGEWEPLVTEDMFRAVAQLLDEPGRKPTQGVTTMLGGLAFCRCGNHISAGVNHLRQPTYRCNPQTRTGPGPHVAVKRADVDDFISRLVVARLSQPDAADLVTPQAKENTNALRDEGMSIRAKLARLGELFVDGKISEQDMISGREHGEARLAKIEAQLAELGRESVLAPLVAAENAAQAWEALGTDRKRAVVGALMMVTLNPAGRGARSFDPETVGVEWKGQLPVMCLPPELARSGYGEARQQGT
jgi:site-specific DNA recombinase